MILFLCILGYPFNAQNTVGVMKYDEQLYASGYNLFFSHNQPTTYLINACGEVVHKWEDEENFRPGNAVYLLENGNLIKCKRDRQSAVQDPIWAGGGGETVEVRTWDNELLASYTQNDSLFRLHHDVAPLPNGNILMILWEAKSGDFAIDHGRDPEKIERDQLWYLNIQEWDPTKDTIVWAWSASDHTIQDFDAERSGFGVVADHPELIDINYTINSNPDWLHTNSIDYNPVLDQIAVSVPHFDELWIIDHSTTTEEAASSEGGLAGKGGDLLYRWGNPLAYKSGDSTDQKLYFQHDVHWINPNAQEGDDDFGLLGLYNNRLPGMTSSANFLHTEVENFNYSIEAEGSYGPADFERTILHPDGNIMANSLSVSSMQLLENGNVLVHAGRWGFSYEITPEDKIVWEYRVPLVAGSLVTQGDTIGIGDNLTFRMKRYAPDFPAFDGKDLSPQGYLELNPDEEACERLTSSISEFELESKSKLTLFPNPANDEVQVDRIGTYKIYDVSGRIIKVGRIDLLGHKIKVSELESGLYYLRMGEDTSIFAKF